MSKLVLHIGAHKTGTTFVQRMMFQNRELLAKADIFYPDLGPNPAHHILASAWIDNPDIPQNLLGKKGADVLWERLVSDYAKRPGTLFLSAEPFSRAEPQSVDFADLAKRIQAFDEVKVVYVARRQPELLQSIWLQRTKPHKVSEPKSFWRKTFRRIKPKEETLPGFHAFLRNALTAQQVSGIWLDHGRVYDMVRSGFAPDQILVWDYDHIRKTDGGILGAFLRLMNSDLVPDDFDPISEADMNLSPDPLINYVSWRIAEPNRPDAVLIQKVAKAFEALPQEKRTTAYTQAEYMHVLHRFAPLNAAFEARVRAHQPDFTFDLGLEPPSDLIWRNMVGNPIWLALARSMNSA